MAPHSNGPSGPRPASTGRPPTDRGGEVRVAKENRSRAPVALIILLFNPPHGSRGPAAWKTLAALTGAA